MDYFAGPYRFVRFLNKFSVYIFELPTPSATCSKAPCISATIIPGLVEPWTCANFHWLHYAPLQELDYFAGPYRFVRFLHKLSVYIFELPTPSASCSKAPCISATIIPGLVEPWTCANFHWLHYAPLQELDYLAGPYRFVRFLHKLSVYIFELPTPSASCSKAPCISATITPGLVEPWTCANFHWLHYAPLQELDYFAGPYRFVHFLHKLSVYIFELPTPSASCSKAPCISATIISGLVEPWTCANFHWLHYAPLQELDYFAGPYRFVRFLHKLSVYIYELPTHSASCSYAACISATIVAG